MNEGLHYKPDGRPFYHGHLDKEGQIKAKRIASATDVPIKIGYGHFVAIDLEGLDRGQHPVSPDFIPFRDTTDNVAMNIILFEVEHKSPRRTSK